MDTTEQTSSLPSTGGETGVELLLKYFPDLTEEQRKQFAALYELYIDWKVMDLGTGGGFPGIPLAILFPDTKFHLVDSIGKKVRVATEVANAIGLKNVTFRHARAEEEKQTFDFVVSRAVMPLADLIKIIRKNISSKQQNALPNGLICLKGGELEHEAMPFKHKTTMHSLSESGICNDLNDQTT